MTLVENYTSVLNELNTLGASDDAKAFIQSRIDHETKKASSRKKYESKNDKLNKTLMEAILNYMQPDTEYTVTELSKSVDELKEYSVNKTNALVTKLKTAGKINRIEKKNKKVVFTKVIA